MSTPSRPAEPLPVDDIVAGRVLDAQIHLLDRQVLDRDRVPVCTVDDLELGPLPVDGHDTDAEGADGPLYIRSILTGAVLGTRIAGGRPPESRWLRIPWRLVSDVHIVVRLGASGDDLDVTWTERWLRDHVIGRIPGGDHDPD
jgi:hypothetical protein